MDCRVKTLWHGQVGVNEERYVKPALAKREPLHITLLETGEVMTVPHDKLLKAQVARSEHQFRDKYGGADYYLVYYQWVPEQKPLVAAQWAALLDKGLFTEVLCYQKLPGKGARYLLHPAEMERIHDQAAQLALKEVNYASRNW
uniref:Uncharacterized protein n=1 Tax=viral metagenome TaxID=1070528 RepID=A0A6H1ZUW2_9ZZZZ